MSRRGSLLWSLTALAYLAATFVLGTRPSQSGPALVSDKVLHAVVFFGMTAISMPALRWFLPARFGSGYVIAAAGAYAMTMGGLLELVQSQLSHRSAEWGDFLADSIGACAAALFVTGLGKWSHGCRLD